MITAPPISISHSISLFKSDELERYRYKLIIKIIDYSDSVKWHSLAGTILEGLFLIRRYTIINILRC